MTFAPPSVRRSAPRGNAFGEQETRFDALAAATHDIDTFCSSSTWIVPACDAFVPDGERVVVEFDAGMGAFVELPVKDGRRWLAPMEAMWGLACPLVGPNPYRLAREAASWLRADASWDRVVIAGVRPHTPLADAVFVELARHYRVGVTPPATRLIARIDDGRDGWLGRRSRKFRASLRRATRLAEASGLRLERTMPHSQTEVDALMAQIVAVEEQTWKTASGNSVYFEPMRSFVRDVLHRVAAVGGLRAIVARLDDTVVGYLVGAESGCFFRGLQMSYVESAHARSIGNLLQLDAISWLASRGVAAYDLGSELEYKHRWADATFMTVGLVALRE